MSPIYIQGVEQGVGGGGGDAYLTVAAADTPATLKGRADYVCDGTNLTGGDQVEINNALGAAGVVILCPGTYWIDSSISMASGKSLIGGGDGCILKLKNAINADIHMIVNSDIAGGNERILVKDLTLDGNSGNNAAGNQIGINFTKVKYSKVRNNWIKNFRGSGISIVATTSTEDEIIANIVMECCVGGGDAGIILDEPQRCIIAENICYYNKCYGIYLLTAKYNAVIGNACYRNTDIGILLGSGADGNIVSGNACYDNGICGISISVSYNNSITGNTISKNPAGITLSNSNGNTISDNTCCEQDGGSGISLAVSSNNVIKGNVCRKNRDHGIEIGTSHHNLISGNYCYENQQKGYGTADNIYLSASDYNHILGNTCRKGALATFPAYGINISTSTCDKNMVKDNDLYDAGATANLNDAGTLTQVEDDNRGIEITQIKMYRTLKNTSGGQLVAGDVVILKAVAAGNEFTTTVTIGDDNVYGMVAETIAIDASGYVLVKGKTTVLKVSGETAIAIGDLLCTHDSAGIAQKAGAGAQAFARALEAYAVADHNGIIDAYINSPWD